MSILESIVYSQYNTYSTIEFRTQIGTAETHEGGLKVRFEISGTPHIEKVRKAGLYGETEEFYEKKVFKIAGYFTNTSNKNIYIKAWNFKLICPEDNIGRKWDATSTIPLILPYISGLEIHTIPPGETTFIVGVDTDFFWCFPKNEKALLESPRYVVAHIFCAIASEEEVANEEVVSNPLINESTEFDNDFNQLIKEYEMLLKTKDLEAIDNKKQLILDIGHEIYPDRFAEIKRLLFELEQPKIAITIETDDKLDKKTEALPKPSQYTSGSSDCKVEKIELKGDIYTVSKCFPNDILGLYKYEGEKAPIVYLGADGKGRFQKHGVSEQDIEFWIDCDENGVLRKKDYGNGVVQYTLLIKYLNNATSFVNASGTFKITDNIYEDAGQYDLFPVIVSPVVNRVVILNERWKPLK